MCRWALILPVLLVSASSPAADGVPRLVLKREYRTPADAGGSRRAARWKKIFFGADSSEEGWVRPMAAVEAGGALFVTDPGVPTVWEIIRKGGRVRRVGPPEGWRQPIDLAEGNGVLYISDADAGRVWRCDIAKRQWSPLPHTFTRPTGLGWDTEGGRLLIVDTTDHSLWAFDGGTVHLLRSEGFSFPTDVAAWPGVGIAVVDALEREIEILTPSGGRLRSIGLAGDRPGYLHFPRGAAVDPVGRLYVTDVMMNLVQVFNPDGAFLTYYGDGSNLSHPSYTTWSGDALLVADAFSRRILEFAIDE